MAVAQPLKVYAMSLWQAQKSIAQKIGPVDIKRLSVEARVCLILVDLAVAIVIQALVELALVTDAQVNAKINTLVNSTWKRLPTDVPPDDEDEGTVSPDPDLGA